MNSDEHTRRLIDQELDGVNSPAESAEFSRLLAADPRLRAEYNRLRSLMSDLDAVEPVVPKRSLWPSVAAEIAKGAAPTVARPAVRPARRRWRPQLAWAFSAGLAVGLLALILAIRGEQHAAPRGFEHPYGSLGVAPSLTRSLAGSPWRHADDLVDLTLTARAGGGLVEILIDLEAGRDVSVTLSALAGQTCVGWQGEQGQASASIDAGGGECVLRASAPGRARIWFRTGDAAAGQLRARVLLGDGTVRETVLGTSEPGS